MLFTTELEALTVFQTQLYEIAQQMNEAVLQLNVDLFNSPLTIAAERLEQLADELNTSM